MPRWSRLAACSSTLVVASLASADAAACFDPDRDGISRTLACITSIHAGVTTGVFGAVDVSYGVDREWVPTGWAVPQLLLGSFVTMGGGISTIILASLEDATRYPTADIGWGFGLIAVGGLHGSIATFSLQRYQDVDEQFPTEAAWLRFVPDVGISPTPGGALLTASLRR